jgi:thioredoxin reductase (NADPH)
LFKFLKSFCIALSLPFASFQSAEAAETEPVVILGGGVGSLTSALYLGRAGLSPVVIEGPNPGGLLTQSHSVQNWPGEMEIDGTQLTERMREQATASGARFIQEEVIAVDFSKKPFTITTRALDGTETTHQIRAESCIVAMGTKPNFLGIPGEATYWGRGVTNCAICDGSLYKGKTVGVVGGGDAAVLEALYLSNIAKEVHVFVRKGSLKAIEEKRVEALKKKENVHFHFNTTLKEIQGNQEGITGVVLEQKSKKTSLPLEGVFLAIGSTPNSSIFKKALKLDGQGYIVLEKDQQTSIQGVYAIGDIVDPVYKQAISAAGDGAKAALQAQQYLSDRSNQLAALKPAAKQTAKAEIARANTKKAPAVIEIQSVQQFQKELSSSDVPLVIDFYATWCGPCKRVAPVFEKFAHELQGKYKFLKVDVDKLDPLSQKYEIRSMPTVIVLDPSGTEMAREAGLDPITDLLNGLDR